MPLLERTNLQADTFWAIQMSNSRHRHWESSQNRATLEFDWHDIDADVWAKKQDIVIAVTKRFREYDKKSISTLADAIYKYTRLQKGAGILGVSGERKVLKVGKVVDNRQSGRAVHIAIEWLEHIGSGEAPRDIFLPKAEIQKIGSRELHVLNLPVRMHETMYRVVEDNQFAFENLQLKLHSEQRKEDQGGEIELFFGTNRDKTNDATPEKVFGGDVDQLRVGTCRVSIPRGHIQGEMERPRNLLFFKLPENVNRHIVLQSIEEIPEPDFFIKLNRDLKAGNNSALIFIHGFNTSFAEAARRTGQIAWDIPFRGVSGFFSWPSTGATKSYMADQDKADASVAAFEKFIESILLKTGVSTLHLIAHSMGSRLLSTSLTNLADVDSLKQRLSVIGQIVLAAPDIDQDVFSNAILPRFSTIGKRRTLYSSDKDFAMTASETLRGGRHRLGDAGDALFVNTLLDTVDTSNLESYGLRHGYMFETREMLNDLFYLLRFGLSPEERRLRMQQKNTLPYWLFPK